MKCPACHTDNPGTSRFCGKCATSLTPAGEPGMSVTRILETSTDELSRGTVFAGRYEVIEELGTGGMGRVYRVFDTRIKEEVALKLLRPEVASRPGIAERFRNEIRLARKIVHKNVCRMYDMGEERGMHFITMEYVPGEDLKSFIRRVGRLPAAKVAFIGRQIAEGLAEAHKIGVVHRDLKPQNIMVDEDGHARIMDFGIARSVEGPGHTTAGVIIGTPDYMSPEQAAGEAADARSDIYSFGVILYEMVTGRAPFAGGTALAVAMKHQNELPEDPRKLNPQISEDLSRLILRCLEKERENRYGGAEALVAELSRLDSDVPLEGRPAPKIKRPRLKAAVGRAQPKKWLVPAAAALCVVAVIVFLLTRIFSPPIVPSGGPGKPSIAVIPFLDQSPQLNQSPLGAGMAEELITRLLRLRKFDVMQFSSVRKYANTNKAAAVVGHELNVQAVLWGSIARDGNDVKVTPELTNVADGKLRWSNVFLGKFTSIFEIQSGIAEEIVKALNVELSAEDQKNLHRAPASDPEAYHDYVQGRYFWDMRSEAGLRKAVESFNRAIARDPGYARAYAGLADAYQLSKAFLPDAYGKAKEAVLKALELDDSLAEAHASLGEIRLDYEFDLKGSEAELLKALDLDPDCANARQWYGRLLTFLGRREESVRELERAVALDPDYVPGILNLGLAYTYARLPDKALAALKRALEMNPDWMETKVALAYLYFSTERYSDIPALFPDGGPERAFFSQLARLGMGDRASAASFIQKNEAAFGAFMPALVSFFYLELGDVAKSMDWAEKAYQARDAMILFARVVPAYDRHRTDPRYQALLAKLGLAD